MSTVKEAVDVQVPVHTAYNQWTQFEEFPKFMDGVQSVTQIDDKHLHWMAEIAGQRREWDAEIVEQVPDMRIAWTSSTGARNAGAVTFHKLSDGMTRVMLQLEFEPEDMKEKMGDAMGFVKRQVDQDLTRFKEFIETRGTETGAWRGEIRDRKAG